MAFNYTNISELDIGKGIDARNAENQIPPGYSEDILNGETIETRVRKRRGYAQYGSRLPVRVINVEQFSALNQLCFDLDSGVDLSRIVTSPLVVHGTAFESGLTDFPIDTLTTQYYSGFDVQIRRLISANTTNPAAPDTEVYSPITHGFSGQDFLVGTTLSNSVANLSNEFFLSDSVTIAADTTVTVTNLNASNEDRPFITYYFDLNTAGTDNFQATFNVDYSAVPVVDDAKPAVLTIPTGTHNLRNFNIITTVYEIVGTERRLVLPDDITINNGTVNITITANNAETATRDFRVLLHAPNAANTIAGATSAVDGTAQVTLTLDSPFLFWQGYTIQGEDKELVIPNRVTYDDTTNTYTFDLEGPPDVNFEFYYNAGELQVNRLCVTPNNGAATFETDDLQLDIYGLDHETIYNTTGNRESWVTHIDAFRTANEQRLVTGLGGVFYKEVEYNSTDSNLNLIPSTVFPRQSVQATDTLRLAPAFASLNSNVNRTRGTIEFGTGGTGFVSVTSATFVTEGQVTYRLTFDSDVRRVDSTGAVVETGLTAITEFGTNDQLTVNNMGRSLLNGDFDILSVTVVSTTEVDVTVSNSAVFSDRVNEQNAGGCAGVFTDEFKLTGAASVFDYGAEFLVGDRLLSPSISSGITLNVTNISNSGTDLSFFVSGVTEVVGIPDGIQLFAQRTTDLVPLRDENRTTQTVSTYVAGDTLNTQLTTHDVKIKKITNLDNAGNFNVTLSGSTVTLAAGSALGFEAGDKVLIFTANSDSAIAEVEEVLTTTSFTTTNTFTSTTGILVDNTVQLDEALLVEDTVDNSVSFSPTRTWQAIEQPVDEFDKTPNFQKLYYDSNPFVNQPYVRSTTVADNMYFTNGDDEVLKFDGRTIHRAGLYRWEGGLFSTVQDSTGGITFVSQTITPSVAGTTNFVSADATKLTVGDRIVEGNNEYIVEAVDYTNNVVTVDRKYVSGLTPLSTVAVYRYYFRLNAVDVNNNVIASAVTGSSNHFVVQLTSSSTVSFKLLTPPVFDSYDYDKIQLEVYRTRANGEVFFKIDNTAAVFNTDEQYFVFQDATQDESLTDTDIGDFNPLEFVTPAGVAELPTTIDQPLRAKYVTSASNRLLLANLTNDPQIDLQVEKRFLSESDLADKQISLVGDATQTYQFVTSSSAVTVARDGVTNDFVVTGTAGLATGDWIYLFRNAAGDNDAGLLGWYQVTVGGDVRITDVALADKIDNDANYSLLTTPDRAAFLTGGVVPVFVGSDFNWSPSLRGDNPAARGVKAQFGHRLSAAINAVNSTISAPDFLALGDSDFESGQIIIRQPVVKTSSPSINVDGDLISAVNLRVDGIPVNADPSAPTAPVSFSLFAERFQSRVIISLGNFPEIFDAPSSQQPELTRSVVDVNPADGQEITGIIPFFGDSTSQDSRKEAIVIVFKTNSIYALNTVTRALTRIDSRGLGCTAPYSIAQVPNGIIFANESGIYRLTRSFDVLFVGRRMDRNWLERVDPDRLDLAQGHTYPLQKQYKLSVPLNGATENSEVYVYDYGDESEGAREGSWTRFDNHPSTGWVNLNDDAFFGSTSGRVFVVRNNGDESDFRDDEAAIGFTLVMRALDFGDPGRRKVIRRIISHFRAIADSTNSNLSVALDLQGEFSATTSYVIDTEGPSDNLSDTIGRKIVTISHSIPKQRGVYLQVRYSNNGKDEPFDVAGVSFKVTGLTPGLGFTEAADTN